jgi:hypothetical protein
MWLWTVAISDADAMERARSLSYEFLTGELFLLWRRDGVGNGVHAQLFAGLPGRRIFFTELVFRIGWRAGDGARKR